MPKTFLRPQHSSKVGLSHFDPVALLKQVLVT